MPYHDSAAARLAEDAAGAGGEVPVAGPGAPASRRWRVAAIATSVLALAGTVAGILAAQAGPAGIDRSPTGMAVERAFLEANVVEQNLGAPSPVGAGPLTSDPVVGSGAGQHLALAERPWLGPGGEPLLLSPAQASRLFAIQRQAVDDVFAGAARAQVLGELASIVRSEERAAGSGAQLSSPGGARVLRWFSVTVAGDSARAEAIVAQWAERDEIVGPPGHRRISATIAGQDIDALARLRRTGGRWRVVSLAQAPWQEPT